MKKTGPEAGRALAGALSRILRALARVALRRGVPYDTVAELAKRAFVEVAHEEFVIPGRKQSASRVAVLTGIHRKDVARVLSVSDPEDHTASKRVTCTAAVLAGWRRDEAFTDHRGLPRPLSFDVGSPSFSDLVRRYGRGDVPARAVLDELMRISAVKRAKDGRIRLIASGYVPEHGSVEALSILGSDVSDLISTIDHNLTHEAALSFFQRKVAYDNLPAEVLEDIRESVGQEGQGVLERLDGAMAKRDRDSNPKVSGTGRNRAMVGVYYFEEEVTED